MDLNAINNSLNEKPEIKVTVASLAGVENYFLEEGTTVAEFKSQNNLSSAAKLISERTGLPLRDNDILADNMQILVSAAKKNG